MEEAEIQAREIEQKDLRIKRLEAECRRVEELVCFAVHDLREPLGSIVFFADRLKDKKDDVARENYLFRLRDTAERMQRLVVEYVTTFSPGNRRVFFGLAKAIKEAVSDLEEQIERKQARVEMDPYLPVIESDGMQIYRLFLNLIGNALKFGKEGVPPIVKIWATPSSAGQGYWDIFVQDNGIGIEQDRIESIFKPLKRLQSGMGLAICTRILDTLGGKIAVKSQPGVGSIFIVTLPDRQKKPDIAFMEVEINVEQEKTGRNEGIGEEPVFLPNPSLDVRG